MKISVSAERSDDSHLAVNGAAAPAAFPSGDNAFIARQPIFDQNKRVFAYELLFRASSASHTCEAVDGNKATSEVIANTMFAFGGRNILGGRRGFLNFTREHLFVDYSGILDPKQIVIEVLESVPPDDDVVKACLSLKERGFTIALDDCVGKDLSNPLAKCADIIKVDFRGTDDAEQRLLANHFRSRGITMLAEKVETLAEFDLARQWGYSLFQGYFFARPEIVQGKRIPQSKKQYQGLLCALSRPSFDFREIEAAIKHDISLTYKFLLYLNSARFGFLSRIDSIRHALVMLGERQVRTWLSLAIIASMGSDKSSELVMTGAIRAHFCELLGAKARLATPSENLFLLGLFSVMDAIMGFPLDDVLAGIRIEKDVLDTLLNTADENNGLMSIYTLVRAYEIGDWGVVFARADLLGINRESIPPMYAESLLWAERIFSSEPQ